MWLWGPVGVVRQTSAEPMANPQAAVSLTNTWPQPFPILLHEMPTSCFACSLEGQAKAQGPIRLKQSSAQGRTTTSSSWHSTAWRICQWNTWVLHPALPLQGPLWPQAASWCFHSVYCFGILETQCEPARVFPLIICWFWSHRTVFLSVVFLDANHLGVGSGGARTVPAGWFLAGPQAWLSLAGLWCPLRGCRETGSRRKDAEMIYVPTSYFHYYYFGLS